MPQRTLYLLCRAENVGSREGVARALQSRLGDRETLPYRSMPTRRWRDEIVQMMNTPKDNVLRTDRCHAALTHGAGDGG